MKERLEPNARLTVPAMMVGSFRTALAIERGVEKNLLFRTWGGLGDQICAEPTLRYALKSFKGCDISLASEHPELFEHLKFKRVFDIKKEKPIEEQYFSFDTIVNSDHLTWEFFGHMVTNCVDFPSMCALRCQLPIADKEVTLADYTPRRSVLDAVEGHGVFVHPGRHWASKTFPKEWWDAVLSGLIRSGVTPIIIGANTDDNRGTVDVDTHRCIDMRNQLSIMESVAVLKDARVLLTNDSSPLHMAVPGDAWIGYIATCKHPDYISHWRKGQWSWRMQNHGLGGIWDVMDYCPNKADKVEVAEIDQELLRSWLPDPVKYAHWAIEKLNADRADTQLQAV